MPEIPDIVIYLERLDALIAHQPLEHIHILNPFVLRSVTPASRELHGRMVRSSPAGSGSRITR